MHGVPPMLELGAFALALVVGELVTYRLSDGSDVPLSHAFVLALAWAAPGWQFVSVVAAAQLVVLPVRRGRGLHARLGLGAQRLVGALVALACVRGTAALMPGALMHGTGAAAVVPLVAGAAGLFCSELVARRVRRLPPFGAVGGPGAAFALGASGILMALGDGGLGGQGGLGLWSLALFAIPALAARYAFERLHAIGRTYEQTIRALSAVPELGGVAHPGRAERIAALAHSIGRSLGVGGRDLRDLERAALLHDLGQVTLDHPSVDPVQREPYAVARATATMLAGTEGLSRVVALVAGTASPYRPSADVPPAERLLAQALKVAVAFEDACAGDEGRAGAALERLFSAPGYMYDPRVLEALEDVLSARGLLAGVQPNGAQSANA